MGAYPLVKGRSAKIRKTRRSCSCWLRSLPMGRCITLTARNYLPRQPITLIALFRMYTRASLPVKFQQWALEKQQMQCQAHEALGVVSLDRGQTHAAVTEFQAAVALSPHAEGDRFFALVLRMPWLANQ
jgi:hypothetical protein